jgi:hypothetical protein
LPSFGSGGRTCHLGGGGGFVGLGGVGACRLLLRKFFCLPFVALLQFVCDGL